CLLKVLDLLLEVRDVGGGFLEVGQLLLLHGHLGTKIQLPILDLLESEPPAGAKQRKHQVHEDDLAYSEPHDCFPGKQVMVAVPGFVPAPPGRLSDPTPTRRRSKPSFRAARCGTRPKPRRPRPGRCSGPAKTS